VVQTSPPATGRITRSSAATIANAEADSEDGEGPRVHARGPDVIGMEDMGPQVAGSGIGGLDIEGALGRRGEGERMPHTASGAENREDEASEVRDSDGDVVIADADGVPEGEEGAEKGGQNVGGNGGDGSYHSVDATT